MKNVKNLTNKLIFKLNIVDVFDRSIQPFNRFVGRNNEINNKDSDIKDNTNNNNDKDKKDFSSDNQIEYSSNLNEDKNNNIVIQFMIKMKLIDPKMHNFHRDPRRPNKPFGTNNPKYSFHHFI